MLASSELFEKGYCLSFNLDEEELKIIKSFISDQWIYRIQLEDRKLLTYINSNNIGIEDYHLISNKLDHSNVWDKISRILPPSFSEWFFQSNFARKLVKNFGEFTVSDEESLGWSNFYWRLVRPNQDNDIGPLHRDSWFWELNPDFKKPDYNFKRIKVWIAIFTEKGLNGLLVEDFSHKRDDIIWSGEKRGNINKPNLLTSSIDLNPKLVPRSPGETIVFHDKLLHGGALNVGIKSRISMEFTMIVKE
tara:strand:- start:194 stop:937 length:744 start_codon:yes stop_codon:yes gene_type:complete